MVAEPNSASCRPTDLPQDLLGSDALRTVETDQPLAETVGQTFQQFTARFSDQNSGQVVAKGVGDGQSGAFGIGVRYHSGRKADVFHSIFQGHVEDVNLDPIFDPAEFQRTLPSQNGRCRISGFPQIAQKIPVVQGDQRHGLGRQTVNRIARSVQMFLHSAQKQIQFGRQIFAQLSGIERRVDFAGAVNLGGQNGDLRRSR